MGKKRCRKKYTSAGVHSNVSTSNKFDTYNILDRELFKIRALAKGKKVCYTIPNPDKNNTKARFIRVCYNG